MQLFSRKNGGGLIEGIAYMSINVGENRYQAKHHDCSEFWFLELQEVCPYPHFILLIEEMTNLEETRKFGRYLLFGDNGKLYHTKMPVHIVRPDHEPPIVGFSR